MSPPKLPEQNVSQGLSLPLWGSTYKLYFNLLTQHRLEGPRNDLVEPLQLLNHVIARYLDKCCVSIHPEEAGVFQTGLVNMSRDLVAQCFQSLAPYCLSIQLLLSALGGSPLISIP